MQQDQWGTIYFVAVMEHEFASGRPKMIDTVNIGLELWETPPAHVRSGFRMWCESVCSTGPGEFSIGLMIREKEEFILGFNLRNELGLVKFQTSDDSFSSVFWVNATAEEMYLRDVQYIQSANVYYLLID